MTDNYDSYNPPSYNPVMIQVTVFFENFEILVCEKLYLLLSRFLHYVFYIIITAYVI